MNFLARRRASRKPSATSMISQISSKSGTTMAHGLEGRKGPPWLLSLLAHALPACPCPGALLVCAPHLPRGPGLSILGPEPGSKPPLPPTPAPASHLSPASTRCLRAPHLLPWTLPPTALHQWAGWASSGDQKGRTGRSVCASGGVPACWSRLRGEPSLHQVSCPGPAGSAPAQRPRPPGHAPEQGL